MTQALVRHRTSNRLASTPIQVAKLNPAGAHAGDLGNVIVAEKGDLDLNIMAKNVTMQSGTNSLFKAGETGLILHAQEEDNRTDPSGNSGDRKAA